MPPCKTHRNDAARRVATKNENAKFMQLIELFVDSKIMEHQDLEKTPHDKVCPHDLGRGDAERSECSPFRLM